MVGWAYHPNGQRLAAIHVKPGDGPRIVERGWVKVNGRRAVVEEQYPGTNTDGGVTLRIVFDDPYPRYGEAA